VIISDRGSPGPALNVLRVLIVTGQTGLWAAHVAGSIEADHDASVVGQVAPADAVEHVGWDRPDLVGLDMLGMSSSEAARLVREILTRSLLPILLLVPPDQHRDTAMAAVVAGAVEVMTYPATWTLAVGAEVRARLRALGYLSPRRRERSRGSIVRVPRPAPGGAPGSGSSGVVGLAASTGGPPALAQVLSGLGGLDRPVIVVQHLQSGFMDAFLDWMRRASALAVELAVDGAQLRPGVVVVAPPGLHAMVRRGHRLALVDAPVTLHRPSADVLFHSMAECGDATGIGVILTGMGNDGAAGLLALRRMGGTTIAQDERSSVIYGMPKAAHENDGAASVLPLFEIAAAILRATGAPVVL
jgi:two-component system chemotaxis response regulator CheB